jgi:hypothetical protein
MKTAKTKTRRAAPATEGNKNQDAERDRLERLLEVGLEETFPASDAVAIIEPASRENPQFKTMCETSSEAHGDLVAAHRRHEEISKRAFKRQ